MRIRPFELSDQKAVIELWRSTNLLRPWNDPDKDIARKYKFQSELFVVGELDQRVMASAMIGYDGHRGSLYYFAVDPEFQRQGFGKALLAYTESVLEQMGCPKLNLLVRSNNEDAQRYYEQISYSRDAAFVFGKRLIADN